MSSQDENKNPSAADVDENYVAPKEKTINDLLEADKEDESLEKYKKALLGESATAGGTGSIVVFPDDPRVVIVQKLSLLAEGRPEETLDLTGDLATIKKKVFTLKEGVSFRIKIDFVVQREIVSGLKYVQKTSKMGITADKMNVMVGSYAPSKEPQSYTTEPEDAPSGAMRRGKYHIHSLFTDDDKHEYLKWEWSLEIKKDW